MILPNIIVTKFENILSLIGSGDYGLEEAFNKQFGDGSFRQMSDMLHDQLKEVGGK